MDSVAPVSLPGDLARLPLRREAKGSTALTELSMMHHQGFPLKNEAAGSSNRQDEIMIWVAAPPLGDMAGGLLKSLRDAIVRRDSRQSPQGRSVIQGRTV